MANQILYRMVCTHRESLLRVLLANILDHQLLSIGLYLILNQFLVPVNQFAVNKQSLQGDGRLHGGDRIPLALTWL